MHLARRLRMLPRWPAQQAVSGSSRRGYTSEASATTTTNTDTEHIDIPNRIERSPTDILYALSSTVKRDPTAPHYKYHDDPYLIPMSNVAKRTYAMAQESGRKAAKWIKEEHRNLFMHQEAQPPIKAFAPKMVFTEESEVDASSLRELIQQGEIGDAVLVHKLMSDKGMEIDAELKQSLLELVCFYNNKEPLPEEFIEERWFKTNAAVRDRNRKTWQDGDLAEQLFHEIEPKTAATYAALIRGMAKYYQAERAYALLQEATEKQLILDTATYNAIINIVNFLKDSADQRWQLCRDLLQQMSQLQLQPDLGTMNALLQTVSSFGNFKMARSSALKVLAEFKALGIEPSLGTYYYLLIIFCRDRGPVSHVIVDILNEIQGKSFSIRHPKDTFFFTTAMDVCRNHLHDKSLAKKVDALLHTGNNYDLIGDSFKESVYYRHFFALLCQTEPIEEFMKTYDLLVPNIYVPEPGIMEELLKSVEMNAAIELVPRLWSHMVIFDHIGRESMVQRIVNIMAKNTPNTGVPTQAELPRQFAKVASDIYDKIDEPEGNRPKKLSFSGQMIGDLLALLCRGGNFEKATEVFTNIDQNQHRIPGSPSEASLMEYIGSCVENKAPSQAMLCLQYAVENNMDSGDMAKRIHDGFTLNEQHTAKLKALVGEGLWSK